MKEFERLIEITEYLLGPDGCPWDRKQTLESIRPHVLEEVSEVIEAIDSGDDEKIVEELGDLFFNVVFFCKLGEKEGRFHSSDVLNAIADKLIRRHPHVFEKQAELTDEQLHSQWESIKQGEKGNEERKSTLDGIPKHLPSLARAQKILGRINKTEYPQKLEATEDFSDFDEEDLGDLLLQVALAAKKAGLDAELSLKKRLSQLEQSYREWEKSS